MKRHLKFFAVLAVFILITIIFFHKVFLGLVPIPLDFLVGTYYPWLDYKWGYEVGVPVKNAALTDVVSALYPWRTLAMDMMKNGQLPLWNPYSFSGTPLLANWQSAPFYPLNILLVLFGNLWGWTLLIVLQPLLSMIFMYLFLRQINLKYYSSIFGAIIFAFSGFMVTYLEYATSGQIFVWLPLILIFIEKFTIKKKLIYFIPIPLISFLILTAGFFQPALYALSFAYLYFLFRLFEIEKFSITKDNFKSILLGTALFLLGITLSAVQLLPTFELLENSIRDKDINIIGYGFGLLPLQNIVTFISPDFFGNPVTNNYWGYMGYQETVGYFGVLPLIFLVISLFFRRSSLVNFLALILISSLLLAFDNPISRLVYSLNTPFISTGYASRILIITSFIAAVLAAIGLNKLESGDKNGDRISLRVTVIFAAVILGILLTLGLLTSSQHILILDGELLSNLKVSFKNTLIPLGFVCLSLVGLKLIKDKKILVTFLIFITTLDLLRFSMKFTPFSPVRLNFPQTPVINYLEANVGNYRVERLKGEIMSPNTWTPYRLMSPSGYDPLFSKQYAYFCNLYSSNNLSDNLSRYCELGAADSPLVDLVGVKYLLVIKRDNNGSPDRNSLLPLLKLENQKYRQVFEDKTTVVLENTQVMPRVSIFNQYQVEGDYKKAVALLQGGFDYNKVVILNKQPDLTIPSSSSPNVVEINHYSSNELTINTDTSENGILVLSDSYYPGWKVEVNGKPETILLADGIYRAVAVPKGKSVVNFKYEPDSFKYGIIISGASLAFLMGLLIYSRKQK